MFGWPLSGYLGGKTHGGVYIQRFEELWAQKFDSSHAIACNSATSGLLAACMAIGLGSGDEVITTPYTMSGTIAPAVLLGANVIFGDVDPETFCLKPSLDLLTAKTKAVIVTNLFGHPAELAWWRKTADTHGFYLIEDNAQSPLAKENSSYAGNIGHIGVDSLNVHKPLQAGEGGVIRTNDDGLAHRLRLAINHGEMASQSSFPGVGLNLRMTEITAAIAITQLARADEIVENRINQAEGLTSAASGIEWLTPPKVRDGCRHVYYTWSFLYDQEKLGIPRELFIRAMEAEGFPLVNGYVAPLYRLPAFAKYARSCPVAEALHDSKLGFFENCSWTLTADQIQQFGEALKKIEDNIGPLRAAA